MEEMGILQITICRGWVLAWRRRPCTPCQPAHSRPASAMASRCPRACLPSGSASA